MIHKVQNRALKGGHEGVYEKGPNGPWDPKCGAKGAARKKWFKLFALQHSIIFNQETRRGLI